MSKMFNLFRRAVVEVPEEPRVVSVGAGRRVYAIGDIHGRYDLFQKLVRAIVADHGERGAVDEFRIILLGDLIDRGPDSASVVSLAIAMAELWQGFSCLKGNHEEILGNAFRGDHAALRFFRGLGRETLLSYGIGEDVIADEDDSALQTAILTQVPEAHRDFLTGLPSFLVVGDYLFVHAGIRPGIALEDQDGRDMRWIRGDFLDHGPAHPHMIVHGHNITEFVDEQHNRIGIDTGAYASDKLTAIGLEGTERWFLST